MPNLTSLHFSSWANVLEPLIIQPKVCPVISQGLSALFCRFTVIRRKTKQCSWSTATWTFSPPSSQFANKDVSRSRRQSKRFVTLSPVCLQNCDLWPLLNSYSCGSSSFSGWSRCVYTKRQDGVRMGRWVGRRGGGDDVNHLMLTHIWRRGIARMLLLMLLHKDSLGEARLMPFNNLIPERRPTQTHMAGPLYRGIYYPSQQH